MQVVAFSSCFKLLFVDFQLICGKILGLHIFVLLTYLGVLALVIQHFRFSFSARFIEYFLDIFHVTSHNSHNLCSVFSVFFFNHYPTSRHQLLYFCSGFFLMSNWVLNNRLSLNATKINNTKQLINSITINSTIALRT